MDDSEGRRKGGCAGSSAHAGLVLAVALFWVLPAGCQTTTNMRLGEKAERQGRYHIAYQYYCDEAKVRPSKGPVQAAIARVAPRAAQHYERRAAGAGDAGNYADAWRLYMQALVITPDNTAIADLINMLAEHHPNEIASAKTAWMEQGTIALAVASTNAGPAVGTTTKQEPDEGAAVRTTKVAEPEGDPHGGPYEEESVAEPDGDPHSEPYEDEQPDPDTNTASTGEVHAPDAAGEGSWLMSAVLSVEDKRFPRKTHTVDDIYVRIKDTDSDPDADLDIFLGTRRVKKVRDIEIGESIHLRGRSGMWYELVVITIVDRTESVRIGIRRGPGRPG